MRVQKVLLSGLTLFFIILGIIPIVSAIPIDYNIEGDFRIADRYNNGTNLSEMRFEFKGNMIIDSEATINPSSSFSIESFDLYVLELDLNWSGTGQITIFGSEISVGDGYMQLSGTTSQNENWNILNFLDLNNPFATLPSIFCPESFTIGLDDGSDKVYYDGIDPTHAHNFHYSISEIVAPIPEPATILLLGIGLMGIGRIYRKRN